MMVFQQALELMEERWKSVQFKLEQLPDLGIRTMEKFQFHETGLNILSDDFYKQLLHLPSHGAANVITVAETSSLYMFVHYWSDGIATPHQHVWSGFFMNLKGTIIHSEYEYEALEKLGPNLDFGRLSTKRTEILYPGDMVPVYPGKAYIHGLWHVDSFCLSLSVRTKTNKFSSNQLTIDYNRCSGIAIDLTPKRPDIQQLTLWLGVLYERNRNIYEKSLDNILNSLDACSILLMFYHLLKLHSHLELINYFETKYSIVSDPLLGHYKNFLHDLGRDEIFFGIRSNITDFELRALYGALYVADNLQHFLKILALLFPKEPVVDTGGQLLFKATNTPVLKESPQSLQNTYKLYLKAILAGSSHEVFVARINSDSEIGLQETESLIQHIQGFRNSIIFTPLFPREGSVASTSTN
ncbi:MAG: hypothetical protein AAF489_08655 [Bacteroidota bacterium]